jgi:four helix bundle protein
MDNSERTQALKRRTKLFAGAIVRFYVDLDKRREEISVLGKQLLRSGTSVGANYREASRSRSDAEFIAKIELCAQEADETQYWLELLYEDCDIDKALTQPIWNEADELIRIFITMSQNTKKRRDSK